MSAEQCRSSALTGSEPAPPGSRRVATMSERRRIRRCPKCRSKSLSIKEDHTEHGETGFGLVRVDERGALIPPSDFWFTAGDAVRVSLECGECGHVWPARALVAARIEADDA